MIEESKLIRRLPNVLLMKIRTNKKDIFIYIIFLFFSVASIYLLFKNDSEEKFIIGLFNLIFFGGGGIVYFLLKNDFGSKKLIDEKTTIIYESKRKIFFYFLGSLVFVISGGILLFYSGIFHWIKMSYETVIGIICIAFFGLILIASFWKLITIKRKLIVVTSTTIEIQVGFLRDKKVILPKDEIQLITKHEFLSNEYILIYVNNPEKYIKKGFFKNVNYRLVGTPISISAKMTKFSIEEILNFLKRNLNIKN